MSKKSRQRKRKLRRLRQLQTQQKQAGGFSSTSVPKEITADKSENKYEDVEIGSEKTERPETKEEEQTTKYIKEDVVRISLIGGFLFAAIIALYFINQSNDVLGMLVEKLRPGLGF